MKRDAESFFRAARVLDLMARQNPKRGMILIKVAKRFRNVGRLKQIKEAKDKASSRSQ